MKNIIFIQNRRELSRTKVLRIIKIFSSKKEEILKKIKIVLSLKTTIYY